MRRIVQLTPYDAIGGVEIVAKAIATGVHTQLIILPRLLDLLKCRQ